MRGLRLGLSLTGATPSLIYNNAAIAPWRTALGNRSSSPAQILFVGDSITEGFNAAYGTRWQDKVIQNLKTAYPTSGATGQNGSTYIPAAYATSPNTWTGTQPYTPGLDSGTLNTGANGVFSGHTLAFASVGATRTWTFNGAVFDKFEVIYNGWTGQFGTFTINIDGVDEPVVSATGSPTIQKWTSGTLSATTHTIKITATTVGASGNSVVIGGFNLYNGDATKGIHGIDCGRQSWKIADFNSNNAFDALTQFTGIDLVVMALTTNDYNAQTALATYAASISTALSTIRTKTGNSTLPCLHLAYTEPGNTASQAIAYQSYVNQLKTLADTPSNYTAVLELGPLGLATAAKSPTNPVDALGHWDTDRLHPTVTGHAFIGNTTSPQLGA